jgi:hypothetical protein
MVVVIALALLIGLVGGWVYAGCPVPGALRRAVSLRRPAVQEPSVDGISREPAPGASTAAP